MLHKGSLVADLSQVLPIIPAHGGAILVPFGESANKGRRNDQLIDLDFTISIGTANAVTCRPGGSLGPKGIS